MKYECMAYRDVSVKLMNKYPAVVDLQNKCHRRIPNVARAYLETGTDDEVCLQRNRTALDRITFNPKFLKGALNPVISTQLFNKEYNAPIGIAPVGLTGLMWPKAEVYMAEACEEFNIPFCLSTLATETPETIGSILNGQGWFQLYTPKEEELAFQLLDRAREEGFEVLVITIDIPAPSRRQNTKRAGLVMPPKITPGFLWQGITHPTWSFHTLKRGLPKLRTVEAYSDFKDMMSVGQFTHSQMGGNLSWDYVRTIRRGWKGPVILKGILHPEDARRAVDEGFDGIVVSNHGGRQFDGALASINALPAIKEVIQDQVPILFDSGIRSGLDVIKALAMGADFVLLGRAFIYGVAALGKYGAHHVAQIIIEEMRNSMIQLGIESLSEVKDLPCEMVSL
jgi:L-lactate dehydrogenase (cytochrome)